MTTGDVAARCFLVEWYQSGLAVVNLVDAVDVLTRAAAAESLHGRPTTLVMALSVPHDRTLFGVFCAATADAVIATCHGAGWPADRISADVHPWCPPQRV